MLTPVERVMSIQPPHAPAGELERSGIRATHAVLSQNMLDEVVRRMNVDLALVDEHLIGLLDGLFLGGMDEERAAF